MSTALKNLVKLIKSGAIVTKEQYPINYDKALAKIRKEKYKEINKKLIKADFGPNASQTYKDNLFEDLNEGKEKSE